MPAIMFIGNLNYVFIAVIGGLQGGVGQPVARRRAGVHPVLPPVQPAADPGGLDVQPAAVRRRVGRAGLRAARRGRAAARPGRAGHRRRAPRAGRVRARVVPVRRGDAADRGPLAGGGARSLGGHRRPHGSRQDHPGEPRHALLRARVGTHHPRRRRHRDHEPRRPARRDRHGAAGHLAVRRHHPREHRLRPARAPGRTRSSTPPGRRTSTGSCTRCPTATTR